MKIMESKPTYEQAQLHLQVYEMRREARLRQARDWFMRNYFADTFDEAMRIAAPGTEGGTNAMMVFGYWDQACALLNYGLLHEDLFFETSGEFFGVWERVKPGRNGRTSSSSLIWKRPRTALKPGWNPARLVISRPCVSSANKCALKPERRRNSQTSLRQQASQYCVPRFAIRAFEHGGALPGAW